MQIHFKSEADYNGFYFCDLDQSMKIKLPMNLLMTDFLFLLQGSLDQIKPVILFEHFRFQNEINISDLKKHHYKFEKNKYLFLNFSIRNSLKKLDSTLFEVKSFDEIHDYFVNNLGKK